MNDQSLAYIRRCYKVPAYRGVRVRIYGVEGVIVGASGPRLTVRLDRLHGKKGWSAYHPTDGVVYLLPEIGVEWTPGEQP